MLKPGKLYKTKAPEICFGIFVGNESNAQSDLMIESNTIILFLYHKLNSQGFDWIYFLHENKIIGRSESNYDHEWFEELS